MLFCSFVFGAFNNTNDLCVQASALRYFINSARGFKYYFFLFLESYIRLLLLLGCTFHMCDKNLVKVNAAVEFALNVFIFTSVPCNVCTFHKQLDPFNVH